MRISCIILARGGSKGIKHKNTHMFCGKPLLAWSILQATSCREIDDVWVSSDSEEILLTSEKYGARSILRPLELATDESTSEAAWKHSIRYISDNSKNADFIVAPQVTSPLREPKDFSKAIKQLLLSGNDSLLSVSEIEDYFCWKIGTNGWPESVNYNYKYRKRRQLIEKQYLENGSFYIFRPNLLFETNNRLAGKIELFVMDKFKSFQIDSLPDIKLCEKIMEGFSLDEISND
ncbi:MAG: acylneuraminate cytidylyltransferase [Flavobacteriaceae bacterium]|nr:acylneuraminate cytidylyltransferase [Flavobacteriaceae bacterium]